MRDRKPQDRRHLKIQKQKLTDAAHDLERLHRLMSEFLPAAPGWPDEAGRKKLRGLLSEAALALARYLDAWQDLKK